MKRKKQAIQQCKQSYEQIVPKEIVFSPVDTSQRQKNQEYIDHLRQSDKTEVIKQLQKKNPVFDLSWMKEEEQEIFQNFSERFVSDAKSFDADLKDEDIFQAMRNMWIIWMLELLFNKELVYHEAMFGYSMLYPYSDNFLDDVTITKKEKQEFNDWFTKRLHGKEVICETALQKKIDALVGFIEHHYPREQYASVYDGLYMIQDAQILSLSQSQEQCKDILYDISVEKGGTSVIADGYLIDGTLKDDEYQFCVDFGFALQIVDDIQDQIEDKRMSHYTLATICQTKKERYALFLKNWCFFDEILNHRKCKRKEIKQFVIESCHELLAQSVLESQDLYPKSFCQKLKQAMPLEENYMQEVMEETKKKMDSSSIPQPI